MKEEQKKALLKKYGISYSSNLEDIIEQLENQQDIAQMKYDVGGDSSYLSEINEIKQFLSEIKVQTQSQSVTNSFKKQTVTQENKSSVMKKNVFKSPLPVGDVTNREEYKKIVVDFTKKTFNKGNLQKTKDLEDNLTITKITNIPTTYTISEAFYEERSIYSNAAPHGYVVSNASRMMSEMDYDMWEIDCPSPSQQFSEEHNTIMISDSTYLTDCYSCNTRGDVLCDNCDRGRETCPKCNGNGGWNCNRCGGSGKMRCDVCNGSGTVNDTEQRYDSDGRPIYENRYKTCPRCNGYREITCTQCNGGGWFNCGTCYSSGEITCRKCNGTTRIQCSSCVGYGYFLHSVNINQTYSIMGIYNVQCKTVPDAIIYNGRLFAELQLNQNDTLICEFVDDNPMKEIPIHEVMPDIFSEALNLTSDMDYMEGERKKRGMARRHRKYRVSVFQRDILHVEYVFQDTTYYLMLDTSTEEYLLNKNPYENVAEMMYEELKEHAKEFRLKAFLENYNEFGSITSFDDVSYNCDDVSSFYKKLEYTCLGVASLASIVANLFRLIPWFGIRAVLWPRGSFLGYLSVIAALVAAFGISKLWKKLAFDRKEITFGVLAGLSVAATLVIGFLFALIG